MKTLLKNCIVLKGHEVIDNGCIGIYDDVIAYIGDEKGVNSKSYDVIKDLKGNLVMPGLINCHGHGPMTLLRGVGSGLNLQDWLYKAIFPLEDKMTPEDIYNGQIWAIAEMLRFGTTCVAEMYDFPWEAGKALIEAQMKGTICRVGLSLSNFEELPPNRFNECVDLVKNFHDPAGRVKADFCLHSGYLTTKGFIEKIADAMNQFDAGMHVHISETEEEQVTCLDIHGGSPIEYMSSLGVFKHRTYAAHCVWCSNHDFEIIKDLGITMVHNPSSNMKLGSGFARVKYALDNGINVTLGTDGVASNNNLNMIEEMHIASIIHNGYNLDPLTILPQNIIDMATINGAKALGFDDTGVLEIGKKADLCVLNMDSPHMYPVHDVEALICYSAQGSDVVMTMVDGNILYENGEYTTIDIEKAKAAMQESEKRLFE